MYVTDFQIVWKYSQKTDVNLQKKTASFQGERECKFIYFTGFYWHPTCWKNTAFLQDFGLQSTIFPGFMYLNS